MYVSTITISSKGQVVLPKKARKILNSNTVSVLINDKNQVLLTPVNELSGILSSYNKDENTNFDEIREQSWKTILPHSKNPSNGAE